MEAAEEARREVARLRVQVEQQKAEDTEFANATDFDVQMLPQVLEHCCGTKLELEDLDRIRSAVARPQPKPKPIRR